MRDKNEKWYWDKYAELPIKYYTVRGDTYDDAKVEFASYIVNYILSGIDNIQYWTKEIIDDTDDDFDCSFFDEDGYYDWSTSMELILSDDDIENGIEYFSYDNRTYQLFESLNIKDFRNIKINNILS